jgi:hypothetical protein
MCGPARKLNHGIEDAKTSFCRHRRLAVTDSKGKHRLCAKPYDSRFQSEGLNVTSKHNLSTACELQHFRQYIGPDWAGSEFRPAEAAA